MNQCVICLILFCLTSLSCTKINCDHIFYEPPHGKTNNLHMRKQRRRSASRKLISAFVFATRIVQFLFYLNPKFQASSSFLCLYRSVCVGPVRKPHCWFSHEAVLILITCIITRILHTKCTKPKQFHFFDRDSNYLIVGSQLSHVPTTSQVIRQYVFRKF